MKIVWTDHARQRLVEWSKKRGITREQVEGVVRHPEQIVKGHADLWVAQSKIEQGLSRVPFFEVEDERSIVTVYCASRIHRYREA